MIKKNIYFGILFLWLLAISVLLTIYGAWLFYPLEIDFLNIEKVVYLSKASILHNFNGLMDYLTNPFNHKLNFASFAASQEGLAHFKDVKYLFHFSQFICFILAIPSLIFLRKNLKEKTLLDYHRYFLVAAVLPLIVALFALMIGFENFFIFFHNLLFAGKSNWMFDPLTDPVIWILPEDFFMHCFIGFGFIYEGIMLMLYYLSRHKAIMDK
ncbi:TIGR01906 family membrane protein [Streptococcus didelphis]|uniref:TIGR01906 family membrane protein n=1 Tax=Streptococcus didelphis TaxID=102886 RepID=UPI0003812018|nr:TIGR01906 family membrane protein [Streptococcus didelphis]